MTTTKDLQAQASLVGKTYFARVSEVCKLMAGGGCVITTYCILEFQKENVTVSYITKASCTPKEREKKYEDKGTAEKAYYSWTQEEDKITIKGFKEYGTFIQQDRKLIGKEEFQEGLPVLK